MGVFTENEKLAVRVGVRGHTAICPWLHQTLHSLLLETNFPRQVLQPYDLGPDWNHNDMANSLRVCRDLRLQYSFLSELGVTCRAQG